MKKKLNKHPASVQMPTAIIPGERNALCKSSLFKKPEMKFCPAAVRNLTAHRTEYLGEGLYERRDFGTADRHGIISAGLKG